ncbi:LOW QUALITY PROTEIN: hypothetical protein ACHAW6_001023, partial [Cyclotella cf. meneghiniana]
DTPLNITLPDGKVIHSTHAGNLDLLGLDNTATLWEHATQPPDSGLCPPKHIATKPPSPFVNHTTHNTYQTSSKSKLIQFLNQCAFSLTPSTWIEAIINNQFSSWPSLMANAVQKYLPKSTATAKGHMMKMPAGIQSTCPKPQTIRIPMSPNVTIPPNARIRLIPANNDNDLFPTQENSSVNDQIDGTTYTDLTGCFQTIIFLLPTIILPPPSSIEPSPTTTSVDAFDDIFSYLKRKGFKLKFSILDNETSTAITEYLCNNDMKWQFIPPNEHRVNTAECAIQTFKNHFISGLCSTDHLFPSQLWGKLLQQAQDSLNMLCISCINPSKSAYKILEGPHDIN